ALLCSNVIENVYQVMAVHYIALAQAVDCLNIQDKLSFSSRRVYDDIRKLVAARIEDQPFYEDIAKVENYLKNNPLRLK
ncbi:MAG: aromatic amino acid lyase, partial [Bacteroidales bacterium]|nr:aromatic amino acid lyase [Bacteroidales bacterium]